MAHYNPPMEKALTFLFLAVSAALFSSCVTDDYDSGYNYGNNGYYYGQPPPSRYDNRYYYDDRPPPPRYDDRYRDDRHHDRRRDQQRQNDIFHRHESTSRITTATRPA